MSNFGFGNDLSRTAASIVSESFLPPLDVSLDARRLLADISLYDSGYKLNSANAAVIAILRRVAFNDSALSTDLITGALDCIYSAIFIKQQHHHMCTTYVLLLKILLDLDDDFIQDRLYSLFLSERGLATILKEEAVKPTYHKNQHLSPSDSYIDLGKQFYSMIYPVTMWIDSMAKQDQVIQAFRRFVNPTDRIIPSPDQVVGIRQVTVTVSGATRSAEVNGKYNFYKKASHGSVFHKFVEINGEKRR